MFLEFEWDSDKARANLERHGVSFGEASTCFGDTLSRTVSDPLHSNEEDRSVLIGQSFQGRILVVVHAERADRIRIISARRATAKERNDYEEHG
jgi:uncharacterized DUF497 family protein